MDLASERQAALLAIARRHPGERVLVVCHSGLLASLMTGVLGLEYTPNPRLRALAFPNTAINLLVWHGDSWTLTLWGDTGEFAAADGVAPAGGARDRAAVLLALAAAAALGFWAGRK